MILVLQLALAQDTCPAGPVQMGSAPADQARDVPLDVRPSLLFEGRCPLEDLRFLLLVGDGSTREVAVSAVEQLDASTVVELDLGGPLAPHTDYRLRQPGGRDLDFRTGDHTQGPLTDAPGLDVLAVQRVPGLDAPFQAALRVEPLQDGSLFRVRVDGMARGAFAGLDGEAFDMVTGWSKRGDGLGYCLSVEERALSGGWSEPSEEVCGAAPLRCQAASGSVTSLGLLPLLLIRRRR